MFEQRGAERKSERDSEKRDVDRRLRTCLPRVSKRQDRGRISSENSIDNFFFFYFFLEIMGTGEPSNSETSNGRKKNTA